MSYVCFAIYLSQLCVQILCRAREILCASINSRLIACIVCPRWFYRLQISLLGSPNIPNRTTQIARAPLVPLLNRRQTTNIAISAHLFAAKPPNNR